MLESRKILELRAREFLGPCHRVPVAAGTTRSRVSAIGRAADRARDRAPARRRPGRPGPPGRSGFQRTPLVLTVAGDNLRLGAATNAVRIASAWSAAKTRRSRV